MPKDEDDPKIITKLSEVPSGALCRIEITMKPGGYMSVNAYPNDIETVAAVLCSALDMYGYDVEVCQRENGLPSDDIELISETVVTVGEEPPPMASFNTIAMA